MVQIRYSNNACSFLNRCAPFIHNQKQFWADEKEAPCFLN